jgi:hypothetical protein
VGQSPQLKPISSRGIVEDRAATAFQRALAAALSKHTELVGLNGHIPAAD